MKNGYLLSSAMVILAISAFAEEQTNYSSEQPKVECQLQGEPLLGLNPAYNAPAITGVNYKHWNCSPICCNAFVDLAFTYWYAGEDGLKIASSGVYNSGTTFYSQNLKALHQSFNYKPGFKLAAGFVGYHEWSLFAEYTWFRGTDHKSSGQPLTGTSLTAGNSTAFNGSDVWLVDDWFLQSTSSGQSLPGTQVSSRWHLGLDLVDLSASRPFYQGRRVTVTPYGGLRLALIRQQMQVSLTEVNGLFASLPAQPIQSNTHSNSWAIGPRFGGQVNCLLPMGFRFEGNGAFSLLYTRYTSIKHSEDPAATTFNPGPYKASMNGYNCLRPAAEASLGLGWGTYLHNRDYHIDFAADYDFMIFWSQNMMRRLLDDTLIGTGPGIADLYLHGLTISGRFDF